eukprot:scaffold5.g627.t1
MTFTNTPPLQEIKARVLLGHMWGMFAPTDSSSATFTFSAPGTYYFACPVDGHCSLGMKAPTDSSSATFTFSAPGTYYFACPVDGHCSLGMKSKFTVT